VSKLVTDILISGSDPANASQLAGQNLQYIIDVSSIAVNAWSANASVSANAVIRPTDDNQNGFLFQTAASGQTGQIEPAWPKSGTVQDGSLVWTPLAPPAASEDSVLSASWLQQSPPDAALTISSQSTGALTASAYLGMGTSGQIYTIIASVTMRSGAVYVVKIILAII
jgi:hypothetical protein